MDGPSWFALAVIAIVVVVILGGYVKGGGSLRSLPTKAMAAAHAGGHAWLMVLLFGGMVFSLASMLYKPTAVDSGVGNASCGTVLHPAMPTTASFLNGKPTAIDPGFVDFYRRDCTAAIRGSRVVSVVDGMLVVALGLWLLSGLSDSRSEASLENG